MSDLTSGRYPNLNPEWVATGTQNNLTQSDVPMLTNLPQGSIVEDGASIITKEEVITPLQVPWGVAIEKISLVNGATEIETLSHAYCVVRSAPALAVGGEFKPVLLAETGDVTTLTAGKVETISFTLKKSVLSTPENAPFGFLYFGIFMEATKVGTYASFKCPATALFKAESTLKVYPWFANMPINVKTKPASATVVEKEPKEAKPVAIAPVLFVQ